VSAVGNAPFRFRIFVNGNLVTTLTRLPLDNLNPGDIIVVQAIDCCGNILVGQTYIFETDNDFI
jgi:hypothetical protein